MAAYSFIGVLWLCGWQGKTGRKDRNREAEDAGHDMQRIGQGSGKDVREQIVKPATMLCRIFKYFDFPKEITSLIRDIFPQIHYFLLSEAPV